MKKAIIFGLSLSMLLVGLTACKKQAEEPAPTPSAVQTQPAETPESKETSPQAAQLSAAQHAPTQEELEEVFQAAYEWGKTVEEAELILPDETVLDEELKELDYLSSLYHDWEKPSDIEAQYMTWREENHLDQAQANTEI